MARRTEDIRRDIDRTRQELASTLEALGEHIAPKKVADRAKETVAEKVEDVRDQLSPTRAVRRGTERLRDALGRAVGREGDDRPPSGPTTGQYQPLGRGFPQAAGGPYGVRSASPSPTAEDQPMRARVGQAAGDVAQGARSAPEVLRDRAEANPVTAALLSFGAGFLVAVALPPTDRERQLAPKASKWIGPRKDHASEAGRSVAGDLQQSAKDRAERVKTTATRAAGDVKQKAQTRARSVREQAEGAAAEVKGQSTRASGRVKAEVKRSSAAVKDQAKPGRPYGEVRDAENQPGGDGAGGVRDVDNQASGEGAGDQSVQGHAYDGHSVGRRQWLITDEFATRRVSATMRANDRGKSEQAHDPRGEEVGDGQHAARRAGGANPDQAR